MGIQGTNFQEAKFSGSLGGALFRGEKDGSGSAASGAGAGVGTGTTSSAAVGDGDDPGDENDVRKGDISLDRFNDDGIGSAESGSEGEASVPSPTDSLQNMHYGLISEGSFITEAESSGSDSEWDKRGSGRGTGTGRGRGRGRGRGNTGNREEDEDEEAEEEEEENPKRREADSDSSDDVEEEARLMCQALAEIEAVRGVYCRMPETVTRLPA